MVMTHLQTTNLTICQVCQSEGLESTIRKCFGCNFIMCHKCNTHRALVDMTIRITQALELSQISCLTHPSRQLDHLSDNSDKLMHECLI
jgi:hypothetical protein